MNLTNEQQETISAYFDAQDMSKQGLVEDLIDHCCCGVERLMEEDKMGFDEALACALQQLIPNGAAEIEADLKYLETYKPRMFMKRFVFISGYLSSLCLIAGVLLIGLSFFKRESVSMERQQMQLRAEMMLFEEGHASPGAERMMANFQMEQAMHDLKSLSGVSEMFSLGQTLMILAVCLFSITILPYQFYNRYQRSLLSYDAA